MSKSQVDGGALLVAVAAAALSLMLLSSGQLDWLSSICGLALFLIVLGYDREGYRSVFESMGFAATVAICLTIAVTIILRVFAGSLTQPAPIAGRIGSEWMPAIWLFVAVVFFLIDRARMGGRVPQGAVQTSSFPPKAFAPAPAPVVPVAAPPAAPVQETPRPFVREAPLVRETPMAPPAPAVGPRPAFTQPTFSHPIPEPVRAAPVSEPSPATDPQHAYTPPPQPAYVSAPQSHTPPPQQMTYATPPAPPQPEPKPASPQVPPPAPGREALIYVNLIGEGLNVLRAVQAENLGRDYYRIVEPMPESETWQFGPGQVVRCKKRNLSSGKAMVAFEEAQRSS